MTYKRHLIGKTTIDVYNQQIDQTWWNSSDLPSKKLPWQWKIITFTRRYRDTSSNSCFCSIVMFLFGGVFALLFSVLISKFMSLPSRVYDSIPPVFFGLWVFRQKTAFPILQSLAPNRVFEEEKHPKTHPVCLSLFAIPMHWNLLFC